MIINALNLSVTPHPTSQPIVHQVLLTPVLLPTATLHHIPGLQFNTDHRLPPTVTVATLLHTLGFPRSPPIPRPSTVSVSTSLISAATTVGCFGSFAYLDFKYKTD